MDESALEPVRGVYASWAEGDFGSPASIFHPDVEFDRTSGDMQLDLGGPFHGIEEMERATRTWFSAWKDFRIEAAEVIDLGDRALVLTRWGGEGRDSGVPMFGHGADVWTVRGGKVTALQMYWDRDEGLAAVGLDR